MTTASLHRLTLCAFLAALPLGASGADDATILGVGVDESAAGAAKWLARLEKERTALAPALVFAPGYPRLLTHADIPELREYEKVAALGICPMSRARPPLAFLKAFTFQAWKKTLERPPATLGCPELRSGLRFDQVVIPPSKDSMFSGITLVGNAPGAGQQAREVLLYLRDPSLDLLDWKELALPPGCTAALSTDADVIRVEKSCAAPAEPGKQVLRFAAVNGKIAPAPDASQLRDVQALVYGAGTEEEAKALLARAEKEKRTLPEQHLALPPGYPKLVKSDELPGLAPGQHTVLLGLCPAERLAPMMKALQGFDGGLRAVKVTPASGEPACPKMDGKPARQVVRAKMKGMDFSAVSWAGTDDGLDWTVAVYLRDASGALVDWSWYDESKAGEGLPGRCRLLRKLSVTKSGDQIFANLGCAQYATDQAQEFAAEEVWDVKNGRIVSWALRASR